MAIAGSTGGETPATEGSGKSRVFMQIVYAAQFFFGGWFLYNGLNFFVEFFPQPAGSSALAYQLISALIDSGLFALIKILEAVVGVMMLANRLVPLAAILAFPISVSIAHLNIINVGDALAIGSGVAAIGLNGIIALGYLDKLLPMLSWNSGDPSTAGLCQLFGKR